MIIPRGNLIGYDDKIIIQADGDGRRVLARKYVRSKQRPRDAMSEQDEYLDDGDSQTAQGTKALLIAILGQAVRDMRGKEDPKRNWLERKLAAGRWILGIGSDQAGVSVYDVASAIDMTAEQIAEAVEAQDFVEEFISQSASKKRRPALSIDSGLEERVEMNLAIDETEVEFKVLEIFKHEYR